MSLARATLAYFALVFGVGFVLGVARTLWLAPAVGERAAELGEMPLMIAASLWIARRIVARLRAPSGPRRLALGVLALALLLAAECAVVLYVRDVSLGEYAASRDPLAGSAYLLALVVFAAAPVLAGRGPRPVR